MYNLPDFKAGDNREVIGFMHRHPFVTLVGANAKGIPVATHIPVLIDEHDDQMFLLGHFMKQTDHHKAFAENNRVLAVFTGPHAYVSASWYVNTQQASTWNYLTVHVKGTLRFLEDEALLNVLSRTTSYFENDPASPSLVEALPEEYVHRLMKAIIAFEIEVTGIDHVFKLSQNRDEESYLNIIHQLSKGDCNAREIAGLMKQRMSATVV